MPLSRGLELLTCCTIVIYLFNSFIILQYIKTENYGAIFSKIILFLTRNMDINFQADPEWRPRGKNVLPVYLKTLIQETDKAHFNYIHCKSQPNNITSFELTQICIYEVNIFKKSWTINEPNSLIEIQKNLDDAIAAGYQIYGETNEKRFLDILVGLVQVKDIVKKINELKRTEYNMFLTKMVNELFQNVEIM